MAIYHVGGSGGISDHGEQSQNQFSDDSSEAEQQILEFLLKYFGLTEQQARKTFTALMDAGEDLSALALGIENSDDCAIDQIEQYIP